MTAPVTYELGTTLAGIATLDSIGAINPESTFIDYASVVKLGSGLARGMGYSSAEWHYGYLTETQYDAIKAICAGLSASVFIATLNNNNEYKRYSANMEMPTQYVIKSPEGRTLYPDVTIKFTHLVLQT